MALADWVDIGWCLCLGVGMGWAEMKILRRMHQEQERLRDLEMRLIEDM